MGGRRDDRIADGDAHRREQRRRNTTRHLGERTVEVLGDRLEPGCDRRECIEELHARVLSRELASQVHVQRAGYRTAEGDQIEIPGIEQVGSVLRVG